MPRKLPTQTESINRRINYLICQVRLQQIAIETRRTSITELDSPLKYRTLLIPPGKRKLMINTLQSEIYEKMFSIQSIQREIDKLYQMLYQAVEDQQFKDMLFPRQRSLNEQ